jgi:Spy/CpxP family protein refolding chaperone
VKKETLLKYAVAALLTLNVIVITFLLLNRRLPEALPMLPSAPPPNWMIFYSIVPTRLQLTDKQQQQFETLKQEHRSQMRELDGEYRRLLENYFALLRDTAVNPAKRDSLQKKIGEVHIQKASATLTHFAALKSFCTPSQKMLFEGLIPELSRVILPPPKMDRNRPPHDAAPLDEPKNHPPERRD